MRKAILILCLLLLPFGVFSQRKRSTKPKPKRDPDLEAGLVKMSPCGVPIPTYTKFLEEMKVEWRDAGESEQQTFFYNTHKIECDNKGILKTWVKSVAKDTSQRLSYSMIRYELNCRSSQMRTMSIVHYEKDGSVIGGRCSRFGWREYLADCVSQNSLITKSTHLPHYP